MSAYSAEERAAIARGEFFTPAELAARPGLGRSITAKASPAARRDPNDAPPSAAARAMAADPGVCAWCWEAPDARSQLDERGMHPECSAAWDAERAARKESK